MIRRYLLERISELLVTNIRTDVVSSWSNQIENIANSRQTSTAYETANTRSLFDPSGGGQP